LINFPFDIVQFSFMMLLSSSHYYFPFRIIWFSSSSWKKMFYLVIRNAKLSNKY
jgi:hypothetical protein